MLVHQLRRNVDADAQSLGVTHALDFKIQTLQFHFFLKRDILQRIGRQARPVKIGQVLDHGFGLFGLTGDDQA